MKFFISVVLTAALSWIFEQFFPWYSVAFAAFLIGYLVYIRGLAAFLAGSLGVGLLWLASAWIIDYKTSSILSIKMATLIGLDEPFYMIMITFIIGFIVGGLSAWSGQSLKRAFEKKKREGYYQ